MVQMSGSGKHNGLEHDNGGSPDGVLLAWDAAVPMVGNRFFMWDMAKLWGISSGLLMVLMLVIAAVQRGPNALRFALIVPACCFAAFYVLSLVIALVLYMNRYYVRTVLSDEGINSELVKWSGKLGKAVAAGNLVIGVLTTSPTAAGAGLLADVQRSVFVPWKGIHKITRFPSHRVITVSNSWRPVIRLHCPNDEIYRRAQELLETRVPEAGGSLKR